MQIFKHKNSAKIHKKFCHFVIHINTKKMVIPRTQIIKPITFYFWKCFVFSMRFSKARMLQPWCETRHPTDGNVFSMRFFKARMLQPWCETRHPTDGNIYTRRVAWVRWFGLSGRSVAEPRKRGKAWVQGWNAPQSHSVGRERLAAGDRIGSRESQAALVASSVSAHGWGWAAAMRMESVEKASRKGRRLANARERESRRP